MMKGLRASRRLLRRLYKDEEGGDAEVIVWYMGTGSFLGKLLHLELTKRAVRPHPLAVGGGGAKEVQLPRPHTLCADGAFSRGVIVWLLGVLGPENGLEHGHADVSSAQFLERRVERERWI